MTRALAVPSAIACPSVKPAFCTNNVCIVGPKEPTAAPTLNELARHCNLSVRQLTRGFKVSRGCSIGDYVEQRQMETAKRLLVDGESVKTIAFTLGYSSPSSFTYAFRRTVGISPSQFRQRQTRGLQAN